MAWQLSHTSEAIAHASDQINALPTRVLAECLAEWQTVDTDDENDPDRLESLTSHYATLPHDTLADAVESRALDPDHATTDTGGFVLWACPHGCGPHTVTFDPLTDDE